MWKRLIADTRSTERNTPNLSMKGIKMITQDLFIGDKVVDSTGKEFYRGDDFKWVYPIKNDDEFNNTQIKRW